MDRLIISADLAVRLLAIIAIELGFLVGFFVALLRWLGRK